MADCSFLTTPDMPALLLLLCVFLTPDLTWPDDDDVCL
jgi:hypothetical protein